MPFTDADEPLTFVAHGDSEVLRVSRTTHDVFDVSGPAGGRRRKQKSWLVELYTPAGRSAIIISHDDARDLSLMVGAETEGEDQE